MKFFTFITIFFMFSIACSATGTVKSTELYKHVGKRVCIKGSKSPVVSQHPMSSMNPAHYLKPADELIHEIPVYANTGVYKHCSKMSLVCGKVIKVTASKYGQTGTEYQIEADSWKCL